MPPDAALGRTAGAASQTSSSPALTGGRGPPHTVGGPPWLRVCLSFFLSKQPQMAWRGSISAPQGGRGETSVLGLSGGEGTPPPTWGGPQGPSEAATHTEERPWPLLQGTLAAVTELGEPVGSPKALSFSPQV